MGYLAEQSGLDPRTPYAATKLAAQVAIGQLGAVTGMAAAWARLFYQYGPFEDPRRLVPSVIRAALAGRTVDVTSGEQVRDFLHVEDVARALVAIATSDVVGAVNVGSGRPITVRDLVMTLAELLGRGEFVAFGARAADQADPPFVCANSHRLRASTGWAPRFDLVDGLCDTVKWWRTRVEVRTSQGVRS
ncbi:MAG: NAD-dependent epimerase/dehydratase family protein [Chloroflexi bacterium]|nr:NAD-dependent epimerase/dehydratase family protein [Chloroflexota bacterium]